MSSTPTHEVRSPSWPENRRAPGRLELVRRLLNTVHLETGVDLIADRVTVGRWLASEGFATGDRVTQAETERVHEFRTRLRASIDNPNVPATDTTEWLFSAERQSVQFVLIDDVPMLEGAADAATDRYLTTIALIIGEALREGSWDRFRTCANPECQWAFYDNSKNARSRWCSMDVCGAKSKMSTFRARSSGSAGGS